MDMLQWLDEPVALVMLAASVLALAVTVLVALWLDRVDRNGGDIHAHADGTVHEHLRGSRAHKHPTLLERYDSWMSRLLGPPPSPRDQAPDRLSDPHSPWWDDTPR